MNKTVKIIGSALLTTLESATAKQKVYVVLAFETHEGTRLEMIYKTKEAAEKFCKEKGCELKQSSPGEFVYTKVSTSATERVWSIITGYVIKEMEVQS